MEQIIKLGETVRNMRDSWAHNPVVISENNKFKACSKYLVEQNTPIVCDLDWLKSWCDKSRDEITDIDCFLFAQHFEPISRHLFI